MEKLSTVGALRYKVREARAAGKTVGFVPTMGALHEGHLALVRRAREECGCVVASVFVNPTQFNDPKDLEKYPRDLERDAALCASAGCDLLFAPEPDEMYPAGYSAKVVVEGTLTEVLEGRFRPGHFEGVTTVVNKLFNSVTPDRAYFGEKDWQQLKVVEKMVRDLNMDVAIVPCPTVREPDGLAMSSRNARLSPEARAKARVIPYLLDTAQDMLDTAGPEARTDQGPVLRQWLVTLLESNLPDARMDYIAVVDPETLMLVEEVTDRALVVVAVHVDGVRLIDNRLIVRKPS